MNLTSVNRIRTERGMWTASVHPSARGITLGAAFTLFVLLCVPPVIYMLVISLTGRSGELSFDNYRRLLADPRQRELLWTSTLLGAGTALLSTAIGAPLGLLLARARLPAKRLLRLALIVPLVVPPYIMALAWILITGPRGLLAVGSGSGATARLTYSLAGAVLVLGICFYPLSMLATEAAARRVDGRLEEAALLVAKPRRVWWRITLPLVAPAIAAAGLIIFVLALAEFGVPGLLRVRVYTTEVFTAFSAYYDFGAATAFALPLLAAALAAGVLAKLVIGDEVLTGRRNFRPGLMLPLGRSYAAIIGWLALVLAASIVLPLSSLAVEAGHVMPVVTAARASGEAIINSLSLAALGATLAVALAALLGYGSGRAGRRRRWISDMAFIGLFAVPTTVVGVGLIGLWNRPGLMGEVYASRWIVVVAYLARLVPVAALILAASVRQVPTSSEEAAEVAGAGWWRTFSRIVLPQLRTGIAAAWIVVFIFAFGELGTTILVAPAGESTLPIRVYTIIANTPSSEVAALALMQTGIILIPLALFGALVGGGAAE